MPLIIGLLDKKENIEYWSKTYFLIFILLLYLSSPPLPRDILLVCTTVLARRDKIVDCCQTKDLKAEFNYQERRKKKEELFTLWLSRSPKAKQEEKNYLPCGYQEAPRPSRSTICPNSPLSCQSTSFSLDITESFC